MHKPDPILATEIPLDETTAQPFTFGVEPYISESYARAERDKLWRKVWLRAGRIEDIPNVGSYLTFDILDDSILIVRTDPEKLNAYHNVCQHRGRRLVDTPQGARNVCSKGKAFVCKFHGWRYNLDGENTFVLDKDDWGGSLADERIGLKHVKLDVWGGWVWINIDPNAEPLRDFLEPAATVLEPFELEKMRYRWRRWVVFDCNWKTALEAFLESYHVEQTHPEFAKYTSWYSWSRGRGKHGHTGYRGRDDIAASKSIMRLGEGDARVTTAELQNLNWDGVNAVTTRTLVDAANRLVDELPEGTPPAKVMEHWLETARRDDAERGVIWPTIDHEYMGKAGNSWYIFPNCKIGQHPTTALCYDFRPYGYDPNKCIVEAHVIERFPVGQEPKTEWIYTPIDDKGWRWVLPQDFGNMNAVQQGMKSAGFAGALPNPKQENVVTNFHRYLAKYMGSDAPEPLESKRGMPTKIR